MMPGTTNTDTGIRKRRAPHSASTDSIAALAKVAAKWFRPTLCEAQYTLRARAPANPAGATLDAGTRNKTANAAVPKNATRVSRMACSLKPSQPQGYTRRNPYRYRQSLRGASHTGNQMPTHHVSEGVGDGDAGNQDHYGTYHRIVH
jgi:hypothetical protein